MTLSAADGRAAPLALSGALAAAPPAALKKPLLLVTDFDDTLVGGAHSPGARLEDTRALRDVLQAARAAGRVAVGVAVNTGRTLALYEEEAHAKAACLPEVDALIAGVGTRVYWRAPRGAQRGGGGCAEAAGGPGFVEDTEWTERMREGWSRAAVETVVARVMGEHGEDRVQWQRPVEQNEHKATLLFAAPLRGRLLAAIEGGLTELGVQATLIEGPAGKGPDWRFLDILPRAAGKGAAMEWVRRRLGFALEHTVACGDGPNDALMLEQAQLAIAVGNCQSSIRAWAASASAASDAGCDSEEGASVNGSGGNGGDSNGNSSSKDSSGGIGGCRRRVHLASEGAVAAAGILEGLAALGFL